MFQNVIPWKFWNKIPLWGKYTVNNDNSPTERFELSTRGLQGQCSNPGATKACKIIVNYKLKVFQNVIPGKFWNNIPLGGKYTDNNENSPRRDLNSRPVVYKTSALTPELRRHVR